MFAGYGWRAKQLAISTAWYTAAFTNGSEGLPDLAELLSDEPAAREEPSTEEFHRRMKRFGWE